jgi:glycosyltransferase involved in cell wall biosynthesis
MGSLYVTSSTHTNRPQSQRTGIPRVEHEIVRELVARGGHVLRFNHLFRRFRVVEFHRAFATSGFADMSAGSTERRPSEPLSSRFKVSAGDTIVVPAILWRNGQLADLARIRRDTGARIGVYIHDIMPVRRPELVSNESGAADFRRFLDAAITLADWLCVSSHFVENELSAYIHETTGRAIPIHRVPLCADLKIREMPAAMGRLRAFDLPPDGYALYVSTLNPRKNHTGLYWLWRRLAEELGDATPPLVVAGQRGWNDRDVFDLMSRDRAMWGRHIRFIEGPSDAELIQLYRNCAFTVFPSLYEGWGLPINESISFGKPCIAGDNTSLREAGQGLAIHVADHDGPSWLAAIRRLTLDLPYRQICAAEIAERYRPRTYSEVGQEIHDIAMGTDGLRGKH